MNNNARVFRFIPRIHAGRGKSSRYVPSPLFFLLFASLAFFASIAHIWAQATDQNPPFPSGRIPVAVLDLGNYSIKETAGPVRNYLTFSNTLIAIELARSAGKGEEQRGFDPATLRLRWLKEQELLWISWQTFQPGRGHCVINGNVVLRIQPVPDEGLLKDADRRELFQTKELFRDNTCFDFSWGVRHSERSSMDVAYDAHANTITLTKTNTTKQSDWSPGNVPPKELGPLSKSEQGEGGTIYYTSEVTTVEKWIYAYTRNDLRFLHGIRAIDLKTNQEPIADIIRDFKVSRAELEKLNPNLAGKIEAKGLVVLSEKIEPYKCCKDDLWDSENGSNDHW